ncbi:hypothetical protein [Collimonas sp.]|uniref:hypothetical protein n=1 Tax=Collimonas sp. TaxID=1963772 RepID=UPI002CB4E43E|nr:hypothetical protein [Collimonas sp.]HWX03052.1 hypothetical protein [Collimonas sp.]
MDFFQKWFLPVVAPFCFVVSANASTATDTSVASSQRQELLEFKAALPKIPQFPRTGDALLERLLKITAGAENQVYVHFVDNIFDVGAWPWKTHRANNGFLRIDSGPIPIDGDWYIHLREIDKQPAWAFQMMFMHIDGDQSVFENVPKVMPKVICIREGQISDALLRQGWKLERSIERIPQGLWVGSYIFNKGKNYSIIMKFSEPNKNNDSCLTYMSVN